MEVKELSKIGEHSKRAFRKSKRYFPKKQSEGEGGRKVPLRFLPFSGIKPTPSEECRIEEFLFQIKGARLDRGIRQ